MDGKNLGGGLLAGLLVGVVVGLLYAPKKGSEMRSDVARQSRRAYEFGNKYVPRTKRKAEKVREDVSSRVDELVARINEGDDQAKADLNKFLDKLDAATRN